MLIPQHLQIDLKQGVLRRVSGYERIAPEHEDGVTEAAFRHASGTRHIFVHGRFFQASPGDVIAWASSFTAENAAEWAARLDGDFNVVVWDTAEALVHVVSDRGGTARLYVNTTDGVVTISKKLYDQARFQPRPRLDSASVLQLLTLCYPVDPRSVLEHTYIVQVGDLAVCSPEGTRLRKYYEPVDPTPTFGGSAAECVESLDAALRRTMARRLSGARRPLVMLSGGIDSLVMLRYLTDLGGPVDTLTHSVEGAARSEAPEGRIAAAFYGSRHHELPISRRDISRLTAAALAEGDGPGYGGYIGVALAEWLEESGVDYDVYRGEDTRLHTPALDAPTLIGLAVNRSRLRSAGWFKGLWSTRRIVRHWPPSLLRRYLVYALGRSDLHGSAADYVAVTLCRYHTPDPLSPDLPPDLRAEFERCASAPTLDELYRRVVAFEWRAQYTDDIHRAEAASRTSRSRLCMPFYHPEVVTACNNIPLKFSLRPLPVGPAKTRSPFPFADKFILRSLMKGHAPPELLYRHKSTAPAMDVQFAAAAGDVLLPVLSAWGGHLQDDLSGAARDVATHYRNRALALGVRAGAEWETGWAACSLASISVVAQLCRNPTMDVSDALTDLRPKNSDRVA
jgi:hypothetical protein